MIDKTLQKQKVITISSIMGNKNLSRTISDGLNAPLGSSRREKAASILNSFRKTYKMDGQGGGAVGINAQGNIPVGQGSLTIGQPGYGNSTGQGNQFTPQPQKTYTYTGEGAVGLKPSGNMPVIPQQNKSSLETELGINMPGSLSELPPALFSSGAKIVKTNTTDQVMQGADPGPLADQFAGAQSGQDQFTGGEQQSIAATIDHIDYWYSTLSDADKIRFKPLYDAQKSGVGAKTFTDIMMNDQEKFKTMFPNTPDSAIPRGASLVGQVNELEKVLKEEYKIDKLNSNLTSLVDRGMTITDDISGYMTARDEYISKLDTMITAAQDKSLKTDMSNPTNREMAGNYMNYLYIMKGRQQKRYTDFLNSAINYHNQELTRAETSYQNAYSNFTSALKNKTDFAKEDYTRLSNLLGDMYDNVNSMEKDEMAMQQDRYGLEKTRLEIIKNTNEANGTDEKTLNRLSAAAQIDSQKDPATGKLKLVDYEAAKSHIVDNYPELVSWFKIKYDPKTVLDPKEPGANVYFQTDNQLYQDATADASSWLQDK